MWQPLHRVLAAERLQSWLGFLATMEGLLQIPPLAALLSLWHPQLVWFNKGWKPVWAAAAVARSEPKWRGFSHLQLKVGRL